jgi:hypothetical protein
MVDIPRSPGAAQLEMSVTAPSMERDLTAKNYTGDADNIWNGGILGGIAVINNGIDPPQAWNPTNVSTRLVDLPNWTANTTAKVVKPFKNFLVALNITEAGTEKPHMVWWSHLANPGTLPNSWDHADATKDAGRFELTDVSQGVIQDGMELGELFMIYKDGSTHALFFVGGTHIFKRVNIFAATGILAQRCVKTLPAKKGKPTRHLVATGDDIIIHNARTAESVLDRRMRKFLNTNLDPTNYARSYMVLNIREDEGWLCFPEQGESFPTLAIIWNYADGTLGVRDLDDAGYINSGVIDDTEGSDAWDDDTGAWDDDDSPWGSRQFNPQEVDLLQCSPSKQRFLQMDQTNQFGGFNFQSSLERTGLTVSRLDRYGKPIADLTMRKLATRIWPRMSGGPVSIRLGAQEEINGTIVWQTAQIFTPGTDNYLDFTANGRLLAIRIESNADVSWGIEGYDLEVVELGNI